MKVLLLGKTGQVGSEVYKLLMTLLPKAHVFSERVDLTKPKLIDKVFEIFKPTVVINCAAYTDVSRAEEDLAEGVLANRINHLAVKQIAENCATTYAKLIHLSTDFVFDGEKRTPYLPDDKTNPINTYGKTKLAGERCIRSANPSSIILRAHSVYSFTKRPNFVKTIITALSERKPLKVVDDVYITPTPAWYIANVVVHLAIHYTENSSVHHIACSAGNPVTWHDFAKAIAKKLGCDDSLIHSISARKYNSIDPTNRPKNSVLENTIVSKGFANPHWEDALGISIEEYKNVLQCANLPEV